MSLCGRVAVITGGARGLGKAYAEALLERQAKVSLWAPNKYRRSIYRNSYYKDKTVLRTSYLYNGNPYTGKTAC